MNAYLEVLKARTTEKKGDTVLTKPPKPSSVSFGSTQVPSFPENEAVELRRLVRLCGESYGFTDAEHVEALALALTDPAAALACFRAIADRLITVPN